MTLARDLGTPVELFPELQGSLDRLQREVQLSSLDGEEPVGADVVEGMVVGRDSGGGSPTPYGPSATGDTP